MFVTFVQMYVELNVKFDIFTKKYILLCFSYTKENPNTA